MVRGLVAEVEGEGFRIFDVAGLEVDGPLSEPVALGHVVDENSLGSCDRLKLLVEVVDELNPFMRVFAGHHHEDGRQAGESVFTGVLAGAGEAFWGAWTGGMTGCNRGGPGRWLRLFVIKLATELAHDFEHVAAKLVADEFGRVGVWVVPIEREERAYCSMSMARPSRSPLLRFGLRS